MVKEVGLKLKVDVVLENEAFILHNIISCKLVIGYHNQYKQLTLNSCFIFQLLLFLSS